MTPTEKCPSCRRNVQVVIDPESVGKRLMVEWHRPSKKAETFCKRSGRTR